MMSEFENTVRMMGLIPDCEVSTDEDGIFVKESWSESRGSVVAERFYYFEPRQGVSIPKEIRKKVLEYSIVVYIEDEDYESAAYVRDIIKFTC